MALFGFKKDRTAAETPTRVGRFQRLREKLSRTRHGLTDGLARLALGRSTIDPELLEEIETQLLLADLGVEATQQIIDDLRGRVSRRVLRDPQALMGALRDDMRSILGACSAPLEIPDSIRPFIVLVVGVNGSGKTTTIGKLARRLKEQGASVMLAAGDTFRAAAVEQLEAWGHRHDVPVVAQHTGADSASVIYDAVAAARARDMDVLIADTAGRLHTKTNLMEELRKVKRVVQKLDDSGPHEVMLVLDATTGQNALVQALQFHKAVGLTGITITKLDGTAKGGIIFAIAKRLGVPIRFIGVGEAPEDLQPFDATEFVDALMSANGR